MTTLLLKSPADGSVFCRVSFSPAKEKEKAHARAYIQEQRDGWWYCAPHYCIDGLVIEEERNDSRKAAHGGRAQAKARAEARRETSEGPAAGLQA